MTDKTDALIRKLAIHVRPTCSELYDEAMQALAEQPAASVDVEGLRERAERLEAALRLYMAAGVANSADFRTQAQARDAARAALADGDSASA